MAHSPSSPPSSAAASSDASPAAAARATASEAPAASPASSGSRRSRSGLPVGQRLSRLISDWLGILILYVLWLSMLLLVAHIVVIPRTCAQRWPSWVPLLGGAQSMLSSGLPPRPECIRQGLDAAAAAVPAPALSDGMTTYLLPPQALGLSLTLLALIAMPLLLSFGAALIAKWEQLPRSRHHFLPQADTPHAPWSRQERTWKSDVTERIQKLWLIEARHALQAQHRMMQHACLYGFAASAIFAWAVVANSDTLLACQTRMIAIAAGSATLTSFSLSFGRLTVRASTRDTSARMFAYALRALILSVLSAVLLVALLWHQAVTGAAPAEAGQALADSAVLAQQPLKGPTSYMLLGMLVALIGEGVLSQITSRAAAAFNLQVAQRSSNGSAELLAIDGMTEQDILRLSEEGIDSIHALAMASTGALYFATPYTLQRLCDWQDAALLVAYVGQAKAQMCQEKLMVRGATDLQRKAEFLISEATPSPADAQASPPDAQASPPDAQASPPDAQASDNEKAFEIIRSSLGFISLEHAREALHPIANDETIRRLRIYRRGSVLEDGR